MLLVDCRSCRRLTKYLDQTRCEFPHYHNAPVAAYGDPEARLLIVGLAPGKHGANASGIPFIGDSTGHLLYKTLGRFGFCESKGSQPPRLIGCRITNAVKCLPPQNKPTAAEINHCNRYLLEELNAMPQDSVILALGQIAHKAIIRAQALRQTDFRFAHAAVHELSAQLRLLDSYHCSKYNTQTGRLTEAMFIDIFETIHGWLK